MEILKRIPLLPRIGVHLLLGLAASIACLVLFGVIAEDVMENATLVRFDVGLANALHASTTPYEVNLFAFISLFGGQFALVLTVIVGLVLLFRKQYFYVVVWLAGIGGGQFLNFLLKQIFHRARPVFSNPFAQAVDFSFPSGHSMMSLITYGLLAYFLVRLVHNYRARLLIVFTAALIIVLIGISRIYLGVHYFSDVVAGFAAGGVWLATCVMAADRLYKRFGERPQKPAPVDTAGYPEGTRVNKPG
jgi:membrane-associated phospholipid phosphatase